MQARPAGRPTAGGVLAAVAGLGLLVFFVRRAGAGAVADGIVRLGWAFLAVVALGGARFLVRACAWMRCMDGSHRLRLRDTFQAVIAGDAVGNLTPLSLIAGEPAKALMLRHREPVGRTLPALVVENLFYTLSAAIVITSGLAVLPLMLQASGPRWLAGAVLLTTLAALVVAAHWVVRSRVRTASRALDWLRRRGVAPARTARAAARVRSVEDGLHAAYPREWSRLLPVAALELAFHVLAITEIFLVLSLITGQPPTLLEAFLFESTNRVVGAAFKFVPLRIGVDEAGSGLLAGLLAFGTATGVTLALIRKGRMLVWTTLGIAALIGRGLSFRHVLTGRATAGEGAAVVVMARSPLGGQAPKTRLADAVGREADRRRLYAAFLRDTIDGCRSVAGAALRVAYTPDGGGAGLDTLGCAVTSCCRNGARTSAPASARRSRTCSRPVSARWRWSAPTCRPCPPNTFARRSSRWRPARPCLGRRTTGATTSSRWPRPIRARLSRICSPASAGARRRRWRIPARQPVERICGSCSSRAGAMSTTPRDLHGCGRSWRPRPAVHARRRRRACWMSCSIYPLGLRPKPPARASGDPLAPRRACRGPPCGPWGTTYLARVVPLPLGLNGQPARG